MKTNWVLVALVAVVAYFVGAKAGQARYEQLSATAKRVWNDPAIRKVRSKTYKKIEKAAKRTAKRIGA